MSRNTLPVVLTAISLLLAATQVSSQPCACDADLNHSGLVDSADLAILANCLQGNCTDGDINCDGEVNWCDIKAFICQLGGAGGGRPECCASCGACCLDGLCSEGTQAECDAAGGSFQGEGTDCPVVNGSIVQEPGGQVFVHVVGPPVDCPGPGDFPSKVRRLGRGECPPSGPYRDGWVSHPDAAMCHHFGVTGSPAIPADFFGPGSEPFTGSVCLRGVPLGDPDLGLSDTIIQRSADPFDACTIGGPTFNAVQIEIVALSLEGIDPITVTVNSQPEQWNVAVDLSSVPAPVGQLFAQKTHCNGGTYSTILNVRPRFTFTKVVDPSQTRVLDTGVEGISPITLTSATPQPWSFDLSADASASVDPCTHFLAGFEDRLPPQSCDCNTNNVRDACDIENNTSLDCNANRIPDECDIASGRSADENNNTIPDECEPTAVGDDVGETSTVRGPSLAALGDPTSKTIVFAFALPAATHARISVYDVSGREVARVLDEWRPVGQGLVPWDRHHTSGTPVSAGIYYAKLVIAGAAVQTTKVVVLH